MSSWEETKKELAVTEPLDPEVIPLCDALNAAGFVTTSSCSGHGTQRLMIWFKHSTDDRIEDMSRYLLRSLRERSRPYPDCNEWNPYGLRIRKQIYEDPGDYSWSIEVDHWGMHADCLGPPALEKVAAATNAIAGLVMEWLNGKNKEVAAGLS